MKTRARTASFLAFSVAVVTLFAAPLAGCAAAGGACKAVEIANDACDVIVPVVGADGRTVAVHVPATELRNVAAARAGLAPPSSSSEPSPTPAGSR